MQNSWKIWEQLRMMDFLVAAFIGAATIEDENDEVDFWKAAEIAAMLIGSIQIAQSQEPLDSATDIISSHVKTKRFRIQEMKITSMEDRCSKDYRSIYQLRDCDRLGRMAFDDWWHHPSCPLIVGRRMRATASVASGSSSCCRRGRWAVDSPSPCGPLNCSNQNYLGEGEIRQKQQMNFHFKVVQEGCSQGN